MIWQRLKVLSLSSQMAQLLKSGSAQRTPATLRTRSSFRSGSARYSATHCVDGSVTQRSGWWMFCRMPVAWFSSPRKIAPCWLMRSVANARLSTSVMYFVRSPNSICRPSLSIRVYLSSSSSK